MKTIGLVGGLSWVSSLDYYRIINELVNKRKGGDEAAKLILHSVNYGEIKELTHQGKWNTIAQIIGDAARRTEDAGADCILIGANTMHRIADEIQAVIKVPLLHIADATARAIQQQGLKKVTLLGTRYTMLLDFYRNKLESYTIETLVPGPDGIDMVNSAIYEELGKGLVLPKTKQAFLDLIQAQVAIGSQGIILGCTEIPLLIKQEDCTVPVFDTTFLHAQAAVDFALAS